MIKLESIEFKNFNSVGNTPIKVQLDRNPTTLVGGHNGAGKSTFYEALTYNLFGKLLDKDRTLQQAINTTNRKNLWTKSTFTKYGTKYTVIRGMKPSVFEIYKNDSDTPENQSASSRDQQKILDIILGMDFKLFTQTILLNSERFVPFMKMTAAERRNIVEEILGLTVFTEMNKVCSDKIKDCVRDETNLDRERAIAQEKLNGQQKLIEQAEKVIADSKDELREQVKLKEFAITETCSSTDDSVKEKEEKSVEAVPVMEEEIRKAVEAEEKFVAANVEKKEKEVEDNLKAEREKLAVTLSEKAKEIPGIVEQKTEEINLKVSSKEEDLLELKKLLPEDCKDIPTKIEKNRNKKVELEKLAVQFQTKMGILKETLKFFSEHEDCPTCLQDISPELKQKKLGYSQAEFDKLESSLVEIRKLIGDLTEKNKVLSQEKLRNEETIGKIDKAERELENLRMDREHVISSLEKDLKTAFESFQKQKENELERKAIEGKNAVSQLKKDGDARISNIRKDGDARIAAYVRDIQNDIKNLRARRDETVNRLKSEIEAIRAKLEAPVDDKLGELNEEKGEIEKSLEAVTDSLKETLDTKQQLEDLKLLLRDDGIKSNIVKEYLPIINKKMNEYLNSMNFYIGIVLDENFNEKFTAINREGFSYADLSKGQKCRVNLALWLAFIEVAAVKNSIACNILMLDEILEPIDAEGVKDVMSLFNDRLKDKNIFVVSQRFTEFEDYFRSSIKFKLNDDFTEIDNDR